MNSVHQKETRGSHRGMRKTSGFLLALLFLPLAWLVFSAERATAGEIALLVPAYVSPPVRSWSISAVRTGPGCRLRVVVPWRERGLILQFA